MNTTLLMKTELTDFYQNHSTYHQGDSGLDLFIPKDITIKANQTSKMIGLGIYCEIVLYNKEKNIKNNLPYQIYPRSSMGAKTPLRLANSVGIIDKGYRGELKIVVDNLSNKDYTIKKGDRLVQLCLPSLQPFEFELVSELSNTSRGSGGFGSTGQ